MMNIKHQIRTFLSSIAVVVLLSFGLTASAGQIFNIVDLSGNGLTGQFEIEGLTGVGSEVFFLPASTSNDGNHNLISLEVNIAGETLTHADDVFFPFNPEIEFDIGNFLGAEFQVNGVSFSFDMLETSYDFDSVSGLSISGNFEVVAAAVGPVPVPGGSPVPEPSTYALLAIGLVAMGYCKKRKRALNLVG